MNNKSNWRSRFIVLFAAVFLSGAMKLSAGTLIDVAFTTNSVTGKTGFAAVGVTTNDYWNTCTVNGSAIGTASNLKFVNQTASGASVQAVFSIPGWGSDTNGSSDPMYGSYLYDGNQITIYVTGLPAGSYYFYLYGHGNTDDGNSVYELQSGTQSYGSYETTNGAGWLSSVWQDGVQYVEFPNVVVSHESVTIWVFPGEGGYGVISGLQISSFSGPSILNPPAFQDVPQGATATFSVVADGTPPLIYQWLLNGSEISGATNSSYTVSNAQPANSGNYSIIVTNAYGSITSAPAPLSLAIVPRPAALIDVAFTTASATAKTGFAATGVSANDYWNTCTSSINSEDSFTEGVMTNLEFVDRALSGAGLTAYYYSPDEGCGLYGNGSSDPMYGTYLYDEDYASSFTLTVTNLSAATYDFYLYGHGNVDEEIGVFELSAGSQSYGVETTINGPGWLSSVWQEGVQYVEFTNVVVASGQPVVISVTPGPSQYTVLSGLQIAELYPVNVTTLADPTNGGVVTGGGALGIDSQVQISATANTGWTFTGWSDGNTQNPRTITVPTNDVVYVANFTTNTAVVTLIAAPSSGGTVNGAGTFEIGSQVQISATANTGWTFTGWNDDNTDNPRTITVPSGGVAYAASFTFVPISAGYSGLFYDTNGVAFESSGFFSLTLRPRGTFTAKLLSEGKTYPFSGSFSEAGLASNSVSISKSNRLTILLGFNSGGRDILSGLISDGTWTAELVANRAVYSKTNLAPQAGKYTLLIPGSSDASAQPGGDGFGNLTVDHYGNLTFSGRLGDGHSVFQTAVVSGQGQWPLYVSLYLGKGSILGWLTFASEPASDIAGVVTWTKLRQPAAQFYSPGFTNQTEVIGSLFQFTNSVPVLDFAAGQLWLTNGNLPESFTNEFTLGKNSKVTDTNKMSLTISTSTGRFTGSVVNPANKKAIPIYGAVLQKQNIGAGYFLGTNESGEVLLGTGP
ncbi:MAG TPA: immunoglobulin domain-containing protein [Verrucomicrobiae bacterium]|nr:immunoglobulin domain-containing protein [Verrucomicrobiae bacterium]